MAGRAFTRLHYLQKFTVILLFCSLMPVAVTHRVMAGCELQESDASGFTRDGDILIGGIFPVHDDTDQQDITFREQPLPVTCETFGIQNYQWVQAMVFAIEEINNNSNLLPNITLGFQIYDSCTVLQRALRGALWILSGQDEPVPNYWCRTGLPPAAIIGDAGSTRSVALARILGLYRYPQVRQFYATL
ncbi:hypothetical protein NDU88_000595 [Pleurodeles waltl]|uniref:Receptor ligand binding region domain-containing protein n=1 Tax=Pleurodeles waltl TaxID=8319 RepID=A0AAV7KPT2_PLEWA|nr:hypothetical protein NDU88_000595 [Pleurodeles waltl]